MGRAWGGTLDEEGTLNMEAMNRACDAHSWQPLSCWQTIAIISALDSPPLDLGTLIFILLKPHCIQANIALIGIPVTSLSLTLSSWVSDSYVKIITAHFLVGILKVTQNVLHIELITSFSFPPWLPAVCLEFHHQSGYPRRVHVVFLDLSSSSLISNQSSGSFIFLTHKYLSSLSPNSSPFSHNPNSDPAFSCYVRRNSALNSLFFRTSFSMMSKGFI